MLNESALRSGSVGRAMAAFLWRVGGGGII